MILVDRRIGSSDLYPLLRARRVEAELTTLAFGDAALLGNGPRGSVVTVGVERKRLSDLLQSLTSGRFAGHQLPGLLKDYQYIWLVVEGRWSVDEAGVVLVATGKRVRGRYQHEPLTLGRRRFLGRDLESYLLSLELRGAVRVRRTGDAEETAEFLTGLHTWWTKDWDSHHAHLAIYDALHEADQAILTPQTLALKWAAALPGVGGKTAPKVAAHFTNGLAMALADESEWGQIDGIGKVGQARIVKAIRGEEGKRP